jgi:hypothetical protein
MGGGPGRRKPFYDPIGVIYTATAADGVNGYNSCYQSWDDVSDAFYNNWTSASHSITTVDAYGTHTGVGVGSTASATKGLLQGNQPLKCPITNRTPGGGVDVSPPTATITVKFSGSKSPGPPSDNLTFGKSSCGNESLGGPLICKL